MNKNQLKKIIAKESLVMVVFTLIGILGHLLFPYLYNYYVHHFSTRSTEPYPGSLHGWWSLIVIGYFLCLLIRYNQDHQ
jgi:polyferredoxin